MVPTWINLQASRQVMGFGVQRLGNMYKEEARLRLGLSSFLTPSGLHSPTLLNPLIPLGNTHATRIRSVGRAHTRSPTNSTQPLKHEQCATEKSLRPIKLKTFTGLQELTAICTRHQKSHRLSLCSRRFFKGQPGLGHHTTRSSSAGAGGMATNLMKISARDMSSACQRFICAALGCQYLVHLKDFKLMGTI